MWRLFLHCHGEEEIDKLARRLVNKIIFSPGKSGAFVARKAER
jgi:hypothetical protein